MSDHLPECECYGRCHGDCALCICDRLRLRAERALLHESLNWEQAFRDGREAGLDAARAAVAALPAETTTNPSAMERAIYRSSALAAIDALREEQK